MRKPLSMKRLHMLCANFTINRLESGELDHIEDVTKRLERANEIHEIMMDFLKYCWVHKDDEKLYELTSAAFKQALANKDGK